MTVTLPPRSKQSSSARALDMEPAFVQDMVEASKISAVAVTEKALDPILLEHRDFIYDEHLVLPQDF